MDGEVEERFGRCAYFVIVDSESMKMEVLANPGFDMKGGAGPQATQALQRAGVEVVLTGQVGPNAAAALESAGIRVVTGVTGKVRTAVEDYAAKTG